MGDTISRIVMINAQSAVGEYIFDFDETGLYRFLGPNSNGKSILPKFLWRGISLQFMKPKKRASIINRTKAYAELQIFTREGKRLIFHITKEAAGTYYELTRPDEPTIRRYISSGGCDSLVRDFGFHYNKTRDICLQIYNTYDPLVFMTTNGPTNLDLVRGILTEPGAKEAVENYNKVIDEADKLLSNWEVDKKARLNNLASLKMYDIEGETKIKESLEDILNVLSNLTIPTVHKLKKVPEVDDIINLDIRDISLALKNTVFPSDKLTYVASNLEHLDSLPKLSKRIDTIKLINTQNESIDKMICYACGKKLVGGECTHEKFDSESVAVS